MSVTSNASGVLPRVAEQVTSGSDSEMYLKTSPMNSLVRVPYDYIGVTTNATSDVYAYKTGGSGGTTVATVTVQYTDSNKTTLTSVTKA